MNRESGFTMIEVVLSLLIVGMMSAVAGMGIVSGMEGYVFTRENVAISQKAQFMMARLTRELEVLTEIDATNSTSTCIIYKIDALSDNYRAIAWDNNINELELKVIDGTDCDCDTNGDLLADKIESFELKYQDQDETDLVAGFDLSDLRNLVVNFTPGHSDNNTPTDFSITINPRNNGNLNGPGA